MRKHVVGLHFGSVGPDATAKCVAGDIDRHGEAGDPAANERAAIHWYDRARELGFKPLLYTSNGKGGFHLRILFVELIPLALAYHFGRWLFRDRDELGFPELEIFPKQERLAAPGQDGEFGNWLRLPGRASHGPITGPGCGTELDGRKGTVQLT